MPAGPFALWVLSGCVQVGISCSWVSTGLQLLSSASHPCRREPRGVSVGQRDPSIPHPFHPLPHCPPTAILGYKIRVPTHHWGPEAQGQRSKAWVNSPARPPSAADTPRLEGLQRSRLAPARACAPPPPCREPPGRWWRGGGGGRRVAPRAPRRRPGAGAGAGDAWASAAGRCDRRGRLVSP